MLGPAPESIRPQNLKGPEQNEKPELLHEVRAVNGHIT